LQWVFTAYDIIKLLFIYATFSTSTRQSN